MPNKTLCQNCGKAVRSWSQKYCFYCARDLGVDIYGEPVKAKRGSEKEVRRLLQW